MLPTALCQYYRLWGYDRKDTHNGVLPQAIPSLGVHQHTEWSMIYNHPREECPKLSRCQDIDFEHRSRVRSNWSHGRPRRSICIRWCSSFLQTLTERSPINSKLGKLQTDALEELRCEFILRWSVLSGYQSVHGFFPSVELPTLK